MSTTVRKRPPTRSTVATKARPYHHGNLRAALVEAAFTMLETGPSSQLSLKAVAAAVGVSVGAPYRHFRDREALLAATLAHAFNGLRDECESARRDCEGEPDDALRATALAYVRYALRHPRTYRVMFGPECDKVHHPQLREAGQAALGVLQHAVSDCVEAGLLGNGPADVDQLVVTGWALTHGLVALYLDGALGMDASRFEAQLMGAVDQLMRPGKALRR